jgi:UDP-N-acetylmuramoyl-tripeptide--D-alanyl-D-alanine ligase
MDSTLFDLFLQSPKISTDTRKDCKGGLFFALSGPNFDGNRYAELALEKGAIWAVVDRDSAGENPAFIRVENAEKTLQNLANQYRRYLNVPVLAITGSNGKTTTKELLRLALATKFKVHASSANFNNHIGLPLSILSAPKDTEILVLEMGDNRPGDIAHLCQIAEPTHGLITNIGKDHIEGYGSMQANRDTKAELFEFLLNHSGHCFFSDPEVAPMAKGKGIFMNRLKIRALNENERFSFSLDGQSFQTQLLGQFNLHNIKNALEISLFMGCQPELAAKAICEYVPENMRSQLIEKGSKSIFLDAYNANPSSVLAALESFEQIQTSKPKVAVLGDMAELGQISAREHQSVADWFLDKPIYGILVGPKFSACQVHPNVELVAQKSDLQHHPKLNQAQLYILLKASRSMALETVLDWL